MGCRHTNNVSSCAIDGNNPDNPVSVDSSPHRGHTPTRGIVGACRDYSPVVMLSRRSGSYPTGRHTNFSNNLVGMKNLTHANCQGIAYNLTCMSFREGRDYKNE